MKFGINKETAVVKGAAIAIEGDITFTGPATVSCYVTGNLSSSDELTFENGAVIEGDVTAPIVVVIDGVINGNILSNKVELREKAVVKGDIESNMLIALPGSIINGRCSIASLDDTYEEITEETHDEWEELEQ